MRALFSENHHRRHLPAVPHLNPNLPRNPKRHLTLTTPTVMLNMTLFALVLHVLKTAFWFYFSKLV